MPNIAITRGVLFEQCCDALLQHRSTESFHTVSVDYCLVGLLRALRYLRRADPAPDASPATLRLLRFVYSSCLFANAARGATTNRSASGSHDGRDLRTAVASPERAGSRQGGTPPATPDHKETTGTDAHPGQDGGSGGVDGQRASSSEDTALGSRCKTDASRVAAFALLIELSRGNKTLAREHLRMVSDNTDDGGADRTVWNYDPASVRAARMGPLVVW